MISVSALTSGKNVPSARFRVRQHIEELSRYDIAVTEIVPPVDKYADVPGPLGKGRAKKYLPPLYWLWALYRLATRLPGFVKSRQSDIVWLERELQPGIPTFERLIPKPLVFDVDDAIWLKKPAGAFLAKSIAHRANTIVAGNEYIADWFSTYNRQVQIVPTAVDMRRFETVETPMKADDDRFVIGWTGTHTNLPYLYTIENALNRFITLRKDAVLCILADKAPSFQYIPKHRYEFIGWNRINETRVLKSFDVGIMPLTDDDWARGKCAYKMLQYMAAELPVIVSPVGMNVQVMTQLEGNGLMAETQCQWTEALDFLYCHRDTGRAWGKKGTEIIAKHYSTPVVARMLATIFSQFA